MIIFTQDNIIKKLSCRKETVRLLCGSVLPKFNWEYGCEFGNFRKFILIFPKISGNLLKIFSLYKFNYNHMFPTPALQMQNDAVQ